MKRLRTLFLSSALLLAGTLTAKVIDPSPIVAGSVTYRSHSNYVEAIATYTNTTLWRTVLFQAGYVGKHNPQIEDDVQWNIITELRLDGSSLVVQNARKEVFRVDTKTGKVLPK